MNEFIRHFTYRIYTWDDSRMLSSYTKIRISIVIGICIAVIGVFVLFRRDRVPYVANFDACVAAGYSTVDSFPRRCLDGNSVVYTEDIGTLADMLETIRIEMPIRNTILTNPVIIDGEVTSSWFEYGPIEVTLVDERGTILGTSVAEKQNIARDGSDFVRFSAKLAWELADSTSIKGTLILRASKEKREDIPQEVRVPHFLRFVQ